MKITGLFCGFYRALCRKTRKNHICVDAHSDSRGVGRRIDMIVVYAVFVVANREKWYIYMYMYVHAYIYVYLTYVKPRYIYACMYIYICIPLVYICGDA